MDSDLELDETNQGPYKDNHSQQGIPFSPSSVLPGQTTPTVSYPNLDLEGACAEVEAQTLENVTGNTSVDCLK